MTDELKHLTNELDRELLAKHGSDKALFDELIELQISSGLTHGLRPISPFLRPYFLPASLYRRVQTAARTLAGAFERLTKAAIEDPEIMEMLGLTEKEERFARLDPGYKHVSITSRLDTFLGPSGFKFLEYNAETPAGVGDQRVMQDMCGRIAEVRQFLQTHQHSFPQPQNALLRAMQQAYRDFGGKKPKPSIAIVDWREVDTSGEFTILREFFEANGLPAIICDPADLEYSGGMLRHGEFAIDVLYKRVIIHEFLERFDESHPLAKAYADGAVCMVNSFRSKIPHKKTSLAVLSDPNFYRLFNSEEIAAIREHIPWTRRVTEGMTSYNGDDVDLLPFLRAERERFVLKPNDDYGGKGITFGWESDAAEWDEAIESAFAADYVVQERAEVEKTTIPVFSDGEARLVELNVDLDPYLFMGEVEGGMVRLASGSLVNITQGGGETALAILEGF